VLNPIETQTVYGEWRPADGLFPAETTEKAIHFKRNIQGIEAYLRVRGGEEGEPSREDGDEDKYRTFAVPAGCACEVFNCKIQFTRPGELAVKGMSPYLPMAVIATSRSSLLTKWQTQSFVSSGNQYSCTVRSL
jgi:hypothetical protein